MSALDQLRRFQHALGIRGDEPWLAPPATAEGIRRVESWLGRPLPDDLRSILSVHDGGVLAGTDRWVGCRPADDGVIELIGASNFFRTAFLSLADLQPEMFDFVPDPGTPVVAVGDGTMVLYQLSDQPGRLLFVDTQFSPLVVPLAVSLERYFSAWAAVAEAGLVDHDADLLWLSGESSVESACRILLDHAVAPARIIGTGAWVLRPEYPTFQLR